MPAGDGERLRLQADLLAAQEEARELTARLGRAEAELEHARVDVAREREDRGRDAEWFRARLEELRARADAISASERSTEDLREELVEARAAIEARDALLVDLRRQLEIRVRDEAEQLDALRERAASLGADEVAAAPPEPDPDPEPEPDAPADAPREPEEPLVTDARRSGRFERRAQWSTAQMKLHRAEIEWHGGYVSSRFRAVAYEPGRRKATVIAEGSTFKWLLMAEPDEDSPEMVAEVERLTEALEEAGWEPAGEDQFWFARRYVWHGQEPPPERLALGPPLANAGSGDAA
jgi:hypothetical protein